MAKSSRATLALLIYGILMRYSAQCTPIGMGFPNMRYVHSQNPFLPFLLLLFNLTSWQRVKDERVLSECHISKIFLNVRSYFGEEEETNNRFFFMLEHLK